MFMSTAKFLRFKMSRGGFSALGRIRRKKKTLYMQGMLLSFGPCICCQITYVLSLITKDGLVSLSLNARK